MNQSPTLAAPSHDTSPKSVAAMVIDRIRAEEESKARNIALDAERVKLYEDFRESVSPHQVHWYATWKEIKAAANAENLDDVTAKLMDAAQIWKDIKKVIAVWVQDGREWLPRAQAICARFRMAIPFLDLPHPPFYHWANLVQDNGGFPLLCNRQSHPCYKDWFGFLQMLEDESISESVYREFFEFRPLRGLAGHSLAMAVALVPPPDDFTFQPEDYTTMGYRYESELIVRTALSCHDALRYSSDAVKMLKPPPAPEPVERHCLLPPVVPTYGTNSSENDRDTYTRAKKDRIPKVEAEILVRDWLLKYGKDDLESVTVAIISKVTGVSTGQFAKLASWKAFHEKRTQQKRSEPRTVQISNELLVNIPEEVESDSGIELQELINQQKKDERRDNRMPPSRRS